MASFESSSKRGETPTLHHFKVMRCLPFPITSTRAHVASGDKSAVAFTVTAVPATDHRPTTTLWVDCAFSKRLSHAHTHSLHAFDASRTFSTTCGVNAAQLSRGQPQASKPPRSALYANQRDSCPSRHRALLLGIWLAQ